jgi:hypothetical protein
MTGKQVKKMVVELATALDRVQRSEVDILAWLVRRSS